MYGHRFPGECMQLVQRLGDVELQNICSLDLEVIKFSERPGTSSSDDFVATLQCSKCKLAAKTRTRAR